MKTVFIRAGSHVVHALQTLVGINLGIKIIGSMLCERLNDGFSYVFRKRLQFFKT